MKEINLTNLLFNNLRCIESRYNITELNERLTDKIIKMRDFNQEFEWTSKKSTYYIESIMLNLECQSIVLFKDKDYYYVCDGLHRIQTINKFINNKLKLAASGLEYFKGLAGNKFSEIKPDNYQDSFQNNIYLKIKIYEYTNQDKILTDEERREIIKYLYYIYNNCTKLELVDIQRAEYFDDEISLLLKKEITENKDLTQKLISTYLIKKDAKSKQIDNIMLEIRNLLCLAYNSIEENTKYQSKNDRIKNIFHKGIEDQDKNKIILDFKLIITFLENITKNVLFKNEEKLHNKYFMEAMYWLISKIQINNLQNISTLPIEEIIKYFANKNEIFNEDMAFTTTNLKKRLLFITEYANTFLGLQINSFSKINENSNDNQNRIPIQEYSYFPLDSIPIKVSTYIKDAQQGSYDFSSPIQRFEQNNVEMASSIIESMFLGIKLPPILIYEKNINGKIIRSVVDGKQRSMAIISYLGEAYKDIHGNLKTSSKNNFALKNLKILSELNGKTFNGKNNNKIIPEKYKSILKDYELDFIIVNQDKLNSFSERSHFVRINGSINKKKPFNRWSSTCDTQVIEKIKNVALKYNNKSFSINNLVFYTIITRLVFLEYKKEEEKERTLKVKVGIKEINTWFYALEKEKIENSILLPEKVKTLREKYLKAIINVDIMLSNLEKWIEKFNLKLDKIFGMKNKNYTSKHFICLYQLLENISVDALYSKNEEIISNLKDFYKNIKNVLNEKIILENLAFYRTKIEILDNSKHLENNKKVRQMI